MRKNSKILESPRNLVVFEAAARHGSFTRAAEELCIQQPSVSAAVKQLETLLGTELFLRSHRQVTTTTAGQRLFTDVSRALDDITAAAAAIRLMNDRNYVTVSSSSAFSYHWMMPRLHLLQETHPDIDLRMQNSDREPELGHEHISLGIRLGAGDWPGYKAAKLADEVIYPVAEPKVMMAAKNLRSIPNLLNEQLIHLEEPIRKRPSWKNWFEHHGITDFDVSKGLRLNDYALVLQAAISGQGFAFGWHHIVRNLVSLGTLAAKDQWAWSTGRGIYLIWPENTPISDDAKLVRDWIISVSDFPDGG